MNKSFKSVNKCSTIEVFNNFKAMSVKLFESANGNPIPKKLICEQINLVLIDILGDKTQSSIWLLKKL